LTTIKEIADMAGVSRGTVDRVLNNRGLVRDETAERIRQIASALDYRPNRAGKILVNRKKALNVALILFRGENPFFADVLSGAKAKAEELQDMGITVSFYDTSIDNPEEQIRLLLDLEEKGVNGIALTPICDSRVAQTISEISARGIPIVTINTDIENSGRIAFVGSDHQVGGRLASGLANLVSGGNAKVGIISGSASVLCHTQRVSAFVENCRLRYPGLKVLAQCENLDDDLISYEKTRAMLRQHPDLDVLYLASAGVYGTVRALQSLDVAGKIKVISHDLIPVTIDAIKTGTIAATIVQQPKLQGSKPLDILADYLLLNIPPENEMFLCECGIRIFENVW
jgi:LacI family transcriptional regulator